MNTKTINVSEATGNVLNWLVAKCEGFNVTVLTVQNQRELWFCQALSDEGALAYDKSVVPTLVPEIVIDDGGFKRFPYRSEVPTTHGEDVAKFKYTTSGAQSWPIIDREKIFLAPGSNALWPSARTHLSADHTRDTGWITGETLLIAAMRCYVISKLGETVQVPETLL